MRRNVSASSYVALALVAVVACTAAASSVGRQEKEIAELRSLWIESLEPLAADPTNRFADDVRAADLGRQLFFDTRFSGNGKVSCGTCHLPNLEFQDGTPLGKGVGTTNRRTMPVTATGHSPFLFWDGRKDSQWSQALGPLESPVEHGGTRTQYAQTIAANYRREYENVFGAIPDLRNLPTQAGPVPDTNASRAWQKLTDAQRKSVTGVYVNMGKAIAAYERRIQYGASRFDAYVKTLIEKGSAPRNILTEDEAAGLKLFIGKGNCTQCHNGPLLSNQEFHNTGVPAVAALPRDRGRSDGAKQVLADEFNCRSPWSDAPAGSCSELEFMTVNAPEQVRAYKVPSLRNVAERAPYMHAGQFATLAEVLQHYNRAPKAPAGRSELKPLKLNTIELRQLEAFLRSLSGGTTELQRRGK